MRVGNKTFSAQYLFVAAAVAAFAVIAWANRADIIAVWSQLGNLHLTVLILLPLIQLFSYDSNAKLYISFLKPFGYQADYRKLYEVSLGLNFVNQVFPSGGISGFSYIGYSLKNTSQIPAGRTTFIQLGRYVLTYVSFIALLTVAGFLLFFGGGIERITVRILILMVGLIVLASVTLVFILNRQERIKTTVHWLGICVNILLRPFRRSNKDTITEERLEKLLEEFRHGYEDIKKERGHLWEPFWYALLGNIFEVATVYVVFVAFGAFVNPGTVIMAYAIANLAGLVAVVPGGIGIYETLMVTILATGGVPVALGLSVTLVYRVLNMAIFLPIGFYYYTKHLQKPDTHAG